MTTTTQTDKPTLDIILPVYNTERYLDQCIESIVNQKFNDWHLIVLDDGSTDSSPEICDRWAQRDKRITVVHKQNSGLSDTRNTAIDMSTAEYIGFVDSDDWIEPDMYSFLIDNIKKHDADIAVCNHFFEYKTDSHCDNASETIEVLNHDQAIELVIKDIIQSYVCMKVFRRSCINCYMPKTQFEDYAVMPHWFENANRVVRAMRPLYHYRMRRSSIVNNVKPETEYKFLMAEKHRIEYYRNTKFEKLPELSIARHALRAVKRIGRMKVSVKEIKRYLELIKPIIAQYAPEHLDKLNSKERFIYKLFMFSTNIFVIYQKIAYAKKIKKKFQKDYYFE